MVWGHSLILRCAVCFHVRTSQRQPLTTGAPTVLAAAAAAACAGAGAASLYVPRYIAEVSPPALRGWLGSLNQVPSGRVLVCKSLVDFIVPDRACVERGRDFVVVDRSADIPQHWIEP